VSDAGGEVGVVDTHGRAWPGRGLNPPGAAPRIGEEPGTGPEGVSATRQYRRL
jgi:hypothetical protein